MEIGFTKSRLYKGIQHLSIAKDVVCTDADTYYPVGGTWIDGDDINYGFTLDGTGKLTYHGESGVIFLQAGASGVSVSGASRITYCLYKNGVFVPGTETPHDFTANSKIENYPQVSFIRLNKGDVLEVYIKSSVAGITISIATLFTPLLGDK